MASKTIDALTAGTTATAALIPVKQAAAEAVKISMTAAGAAFIEAADATAQGALLTQLNATNLTSGTVPDARFPATLPAISGANLTNLDAADLATGIIPDARMPNLTGDVTTAEGAVATTIANDAVTTVKILNSNVTLAKIANIADQTILGNNTGGSAAPVALTAAQTKTVLSLPGTANTYSINFAMKRDAAFGNATQDIWVKVPTGFAGSLVSITGLRTQSGTITMAVKIGTTDVTSLSALSVTSTPQDVTATGANTVAAGDNINIVTTSAASDLGLRFTLNFTRS